MQWGHAVRKAQYRTCWGTNIYILHRCVAADSRAINKKIELNYPQYEILGVSPAKTPNDLLTVRLKEKNDIGFIPHLYVSLDAYSLEEKQPIRNSCQRYLRTLLTLVNKLIDGRSVANL